jgi:SAM-dependent methyltransferase
MERIDLERFATDARAEGGVRYNVDFIKAETYDRLFDELGVTKDSRIVDLGAGYAPIIDDWGQSRYTAELTKRGATIIPVELSEVKAQSWRIFSKMKRSEGLNVKPVVARSEELPLPKESMDGAISINLFNAPHPEPKLYVEATLQELFSVLKPGGFFIVSTFGYTKSQNPEGKTVYNNFIPEEKHITSDIVQSLALQIGFSEVSKIELNEESIARTLEDWKTNKAVRQLGLHSPSNIHPIGLLMKKPL